MAGPAETDFSIKYPGSAYSKLWRVKTVVQRCDACGGTGQTQVKCAVCRGSGRCRACNGMGTVKKPITEQRWRRTPNGDKLVSSTKLRDVPCEACCGTGRCTNCKGAGKVADRCPACGGSGKVTGQDTGSREENLRLHIRNLQQHLRQTRWNL